MRAQRLRVAEQRLAAPTYASPRPGAPPLRLLWSPPNAYAAAAARSEDGGPDPDEEQLAVYRALCELTEAFEIANDDRVVDGYGMIARRQLRRGEVMWDVTARYEDTPLARGEGFGADSERFIRLRSGTAARFTLRDAAPRAGGDGAQRAIVYNVNESPAHREAVASARGAVAAELSKAALAAGRADLAVKFSSEEDSSAASADVARAQLSRSRNGGLANLVWKYDIKPSTETLFPHRLQLHVTRDVAAGEELFAVCVTPAKPRALVSCL